MIKPERYDPRRQIQPPSRRQIRRSSRFLKQALAVFSSIIVLGTILLLTSVVIQQRDSAEERAWNDTSNLSGAFEEQVRRVIDSVQGAMSLLKPRLAAEGKAFNLPDWIANAPEFAKTTVQVAFTGPDGKLLSTSLDRNPRPVDLSDREHIKVFLSGRRGLFVSKPVVGRISRQTTIQVSDRVEHPDGTLAGIVVFSLSPDFLTTLHKSVNLGKSGTMILTGIDGVIRASFAGYQKADHEYVGTSLAGMKALEDAKNGVSGAYEGINPLNGEPTYFHWRKVAGYPLAVIVGIGRAEVFAVADSSAVMLGILGAAVLALTLVMSMILNREITRRVLREVALFDESRKLIRANDNLQRRHRQLLAASAELTAERARLQHLNKELETAKELAEQANQAKTSLLMNMSHEFRTPMHAILNYTSMGLKKIDSPDLDKVKKYLTNIQISGVRLLGMLNALLDLAKLESGKYELRLSRGDIAQIVLQSQSELESLFDAKQLHLNLECLSRDTGAMFDQQRMMQVFINLLSNAIKFAPAGSTVSVTVEAGDLDGERPALHCTVSDEGIGIPEGDLETIFDKFAQSSKTASGAGGSGLGLAICREIVHLHQGKIWACNAFNGGAVIHLLLPRDIQGDPGTGASAGFSAAAAAIDESVGV